MPCECIAETRDSIYTPAVKELVAIGAAIVANCEPCFRYHYDQARRLGVSRADMSAAVATAETVKGVPAAAVSELAARYLEADGAAADAAAGVTADPPSGCCG